MTLITVLQGETSPAITGKVDNWQQVSADQLIDVKLVGDEAVSAERAEELKTAVTIISSTAIATPVNPNPFEERFIFVSYCYITLRNAKVITQQPQVLVTQAHSMQSLTLVQ